jgi:hypothetical protein
MSYDFPLLLVQMDISSVGFYLFKRFVFKVTVSDVVYGTSSLFQKVSDLKTCLEIGYSDRFFYDYLQKNTTLVP